MSVHPQQVASVLQRAVQEVLSRGLNDPRVRGLVSVTRVEVSPDQLYATVYVSIMPAERATGTMHGLRAATSYVQGRVAQGVAMRRVPRLTFKLDASLKKQAAVHAALAKTRHEREDDAGDAPEGPMEDRLP